MKLAIKSIDAQKEYDDKFPDRHCTIHKTCCKQCPSERNREEGIEDPESKDIRDSFSKEFIAHEFLFVCAWRPNKLCKGNCDYMGIDQDFINNHKILSKERN